MSGSQSLTDIKEGQPSLATSTTLTSPDASTPLERDPNEEGQVEGEVSETTLFPSEGNGTLPADSTAVAEDKDDGKAIEEKTNGNGTLKENEPLKLVLEGIEALSQQEQTIVRGNLARLGTYPTELPLSGSWTLYFSDTSSQKGSSHGATQEQYTESQTPIFTVSSVPALCGSLKAYKRLVRSKRVKAIGPDTMGLAQFRPGQNLHFFREGVSPTWEDAMNEKGGRLTISPPTQLVDLCFERLVLLLAGSALESGTSALLNPPTSSGPKGAKIPEGLIIGVVASRRARGDRIELWLGGGEPRTPAPQEWIEKLKIVLSDELEMPELKTGKYKKHF